jgi:hypothetical protein
MNRTLVAALFAASTLLSVGPAAAGPLDPDCTAEKAAKSAAAKATVGVGGRCSPAEAAKDTAKGATGIGDGDRKKPLSGDRDRKNNKDNDNNRNKNKN